MNAPAPLGSYLPFVRRIAGGIRARVPSCVEVDDLIQEGFIGLMQAADSYEPRDGVTFEAFASRRVRGAIIDSMRALDWVPRQARARAKTGGEAFSMVSDEDVLDELTSTDDIVARLLDDELGRTLDTALRGLRKLHRVVIELTCGENMTLDDVATMMGCDKSYVCRLRSSAIKSLTRKVDWYIR